MLDLINPQIRPYHVLPYRARVDLGAMAMKGYSEFPKSLVLLKPFLILYYYILYKH